MPVLNKNASGQILEAMLTPQAAIPTADGLTTGILAPVQNPQVIKVTSANANHILTLPAPVVGKILILLIGATACKLKASAPATVGINGGIGAAKVATMPAAATVVLICETALNWKAFMMHTADGTLAAVPAAA